MTRVNTDWVVVASESSTVQIKLNNVKTCVWSYTPLRFDEVYFESMRGIFICIHYLLKIWCNILLMKSVLILSPITIDKNLKRLRREIYLPNIPSKYATANVYQIPNIDHLLFNHLIVCIDLYCILRDCPYKTRQYYVSSPKHTQSHQFEHGNREKLHYYGHSRY